MLLGDGYALCENDVQAADGGVVSQGRRSCRSAALRNAMRSHSARETPALRAARSTKRRSDGVHDTDSDVLLSLLRFLMRGRPMMGFDIAPR